MRTTWSFKLLLAGLLVLSSSFAANAANEYFRGKVYFKDAQILVDSNTTGSFNKAQLANRTRYLDLPLSSFLVTASGIPIGTATEPGSVVANAIPAAEWAQSETGKVSTSFFVPEDYVSGNTFVCFFSLDAASTDTTVDFEVYVNAADAAYDAAVTNQTPVAVANDTTKNQDLSFVLATDTFSAGNLVTFNVWRAAGTGAGSNLNLLGCHLQYTADM